MNINNQHIRVTHHPKFLQSMLDNFAYSLELLKNVAENAETSKEILKNNHTKSINKWASENHQAFNLAPQFNKIVITILGSAGLLSVCDESTKKYNSNKVLNDKIRDIKKNFDYKNIRDILTHWSEYSLGVGWLQKSNVVPKRAPVLAIGIHDAKFQIYSYKVDLLKFYENILPIYSAVRKILIKEEAKLLEKREKQK